MKNKISQQHTVGAVLICLLMIGISATTGFVVLEDTIEASEAFEPLGYETQVSTDYGYYKKITIESDYVTNSLAEYPILIHDDTGDLLGKILTDASDIAFYAVGNSTQYNHEIEKYNTSNGHLWAWVNITSLPAGSDTVLYMYYGDNDGGYSVGHNPKNVWDSSFLAVYHMNQTVGTSCYDSTNNANHGVYTNGLPSAINSSSTLGTGQLFSWNDNSNLTAPSGCNYGASYSFETWANMYDIAEDHNIMHFWEDANNRVFFESPTDQDDYMCYGIEASAEQWNMRGYEANLSYPVYFGYTWANNDMDCQKNTTTLFHDETCAIAAPVGTVYNVIGNHPVASRAFNGTMDEVRLSNIKRNGTWCNVTFHTFNQTSGFVTLGAEQEQEGPVVSVYQIKGLTNNRVTFAGTAGTIVWCNSSGGYNEWLEINMSINSSDNVTEIRVFMDDFNDTDAWMNASNITMYVSSDNSSYGEMGTFTDGGSNCSKHINATNWNAGTMGADPFAGAGLTNKNTSIFLVFKLEIPADSPTDSFYSATSDSFKIYIGHYV